jgi:general secretion pathway protein I
MKHGARGFTLLEVLIALAVVALVLVALVRTAGTAARALEREREVTLATWVAANVLAEQRIAGGMPALGRREGSQRLGAREWRWQSVVQATEEPAIRRIDVRVFAESAPEDSVATLSGFAGRR